MAGEDQRVTGGCACGALRYEAGPVQAVDACHCGQCRRASGTTPVVWATVASAGFRWVKGEPRYYQSSDHGRRGFCAACGTPVIFDSSRWPKELDLTIGSLDEPEAHPPQRESFLRDKLSWVRADPALPQLPGELPGEDD